MILPIVFFACTDLASAAPASSLNNIARGKTYTLDPAPNYQYCTDTADIKQLTDGTYTSGYFWTQKSTVGWVGKYPVITIDLGKIYPIKGLSFSTAAGVAGVQWPSIIQIMVSDDGSRYYEAGELVSLSEAGNRHPGGTGTYKLHQYWTDALMTHGRYLSLTVIGKPCIFVDEIEVYEGVATDLKIPLSGHPASDVKTSVFQSLDGIRVKSRLQKDINSIRNILAGMPASADADNTISGRLAAAEEELRQSSTAQTQDSQAIIPLNNLHKRILNIQAGLWRAAGFPGLTSWQNGLWDPLEVTHTPSINAASSVEVQMMLNEYRAGAFNISNAFDEDIAIRLEIAGLPGGNNPPYITVYEVAWTCTSGGYCFPAALLEAKQSNGEFLINAPSGLTRQVWFTFHPTNMEPGLYNGRIVLTGGQQQRTVPLILKIYPFNFPDQPSLHLGGWDYTDMDSFLGITPENRNKIIVHLRDHFVDSPWATASVMPFASLGKSPDTARFDKWLQRWPGARQYCVFLNAPNQLSGVSMGSPEFVQSVKRWISFWASHLQSLGYKPDQLHLLLVDEPNTPAQEEVILQWAKAIRAAGTGVKIWEDPVHQDLLKANQEMLAVCDVLCPNRWSILNSPPALKEYFNNRKQKGLKLGIYSCKGPARELDPYTYYRLQSWACWDYGASASYFWSFTDTGGGSSWNEFKLSGDAYVPFFIDATTVSAGKQMEAIREGVQDYEYLVMLRDDIATLEKRQPKSELLARARKLLDDAPEQVCHAEGTTSSLWLEPKNRSLADQMRQKILEMLMEIQGFRLDSPKSLKVMPSTP